jgi:TIGR02281 family clan AA aspartic protease
VIDAPLARLDSLAFGGWEFSDVPAFVMPQMDDEVLLGMRILRHFHWQQEGGTLRLQTPQ